MTRVLVIDDQRDVRAMICMVLRVNHFGVSEACSAEAGMQMFAASDFDLAIVDVFLQDASGFDVIAMMREKSPDLPVVAISGMTSFEVASYSAELPNVVCLQKPFRPYDLISAIEKARDALRQVALRERRPELPEQERPDKAGRSSLSLNFESQEPLS
jgi:DNA-binding NtrC family response regulator